MLEHPLQKKIDIGTTFTEIISFIIGQPLQNCLCMHEYFKKKNPGISEHFFLILGKFKKITSQKLVREKK